MNTMRIEQTASYIIEYNLYVTIGCSVHGKTIRLTTHHSATLYIMRMVSLRKQPIFSIEHIVSRFLSTLWSVYCNNVVRTYFVLASRVHRAHNNNNISLARGLFHSALSIIVIIVIITNAYKWCIRCHHVLASNRISHSKFMPFDSIIAFRFGYWILLLANIHIVQNIILLYQFIFHIY